MKIPGHSSIGILLLIVFLQAMILGEDFTYITLDFCFKNLTTPVAEMKARINTMKHSMYDCPEIRLDPVSINKVPWLYLHFMNNLILF